MFSKPYATMIYVTDMKAAVAFYTETLEIPAKFTDDHWTELDLGGHTLALHSSETAHVRDALTPKIILEVADIEKTVGDLKEKRVEFVQQVEEIGGDCGWCATLVDPAGNPVGLYQRKGRE